MMWVMNRKRPQPCFLDTYPPLNSGIPQGLQPCSVLPDSPQQLPCISVLDGTLSPQAQTMSNISRTNRSLGTHEHPLI